MDYLAALRTLRAAAVQARTTPAGAAPGRITAESDGDTMRVRVIGAISWWAGNDVVPVAERLMDERPAAVNLYIDSPGGDLFDALALRAALDASGATVTSEAGSVVASAAVPVFLAGATRTGQSYTRAMVHRPRATFIAHGSVEGLVAALQEFTPTLEAAVGLYRDTIATHVGGATVDGWLAQSADTWLTAAEAADNGILTEAPAEEDDSEPTAQFRHLVQGLASLYGTSTRRH